MVCPQSIQESDNNMANCFNSDSMENNLTFFKHLDYSYAACLTECQTNYIVKKCGCRDPFQPRKLTS